MKHYGIWIGGDVQAWQMKTDGFIFYCESRGVVEEQIKYYLKDRFRSPDAPPMEVREFPNDETHERVRKDFTANFTDLYPKP